MLNNDDGHRGITLELSVHSPSDPEHYWLEFRNTMNDTVWCVSRKDIPLVRLNDEAHGWRDGRRRSLDVGANLRIFGNPKGLGIDSGSAGLAKQKRLPQAKVIRGLDIRLQLPRHFSIFRGLSEIIRRFLYLVQEDMQHVVLTPRRIACNISAGTVRSWQRVAAIRESPFELKVDELPKVEVINAGWDKADPRSISWKSATCTTLMQPQMEHQRLLRSRQTLLLRQPPGILIPANTSQ